MAKSETNPKVDAFLARTTEWRAEIEALRKIILDCQLTEDFKWGWPCYSIDKKNVVLIHGFKEYCALLLFKGALMTDPEKILVQQTENVQAARQIRFTGLDEIKRMDNILKAYIHQAVDVEKAGFKVDFKKASEFAVVEEFQAKLDAMPELKTAFQALTPGRQRGYLLHFSSAKQSKTREARIEKYMPKIFDGKGLED
ncbi:YdeI/OmpD-associated family protein [Rhizobium sp. TH2]|uniref:YdeI/OmpD-associated family protein n=1 Tax=Rhizobium sp. TH2 TaxID=2775403 RepID=UPI00215760EC|nr:YdeI family protein [Rhizobium sp. TH2]UVC10402.1 YdeI/OmpD-associated family protein [Rhizobium sp. TH2]